MGQFVINIAFACGVVLVCVAVSYAMTSGNKLVRLWGCRVAAGAFAAFGLGFLAMSALSETSRGAGVLWAAVMFAVASWQWRLSTRPRA